MKLSDLIKKIGNKNIKVQILSSCISYCSTNNKNVTTVTFRTTEANTTDIMKDKKEALICWVDKDKLKNAFKEDEKE